MTTWQELKTAIHARYEAVDVSPRAIKMQFQVSDERSQLVFVTVLTDYADRDWVAIDSPVGEMARIDLATALRLVENSSCGALCRLMLAGAELVTVRHSAPLWNLSWDEFDVPLKFVTAAADDLEKKLSGTDRF